MRCGVLPLAYAMEFLHDELRLQVCSGGALQVTASSSKSIWAEIRRHYRRISDAGKLFFLRINEQIKFDSAEN